MSEASIPLRRPHPWMGPRRLLGDDRLAQLAAEGDERAFARIYERHHQGLYRYCRSILRNDEDAADALQNTMVKALRALRGESRSIALKPWLYRIAHNEAISLLRRRGYDQPIDRVVEIPDTEQVDGAARERLRALIADLAELPERQRGALVMRELNGLSYAEIGAALDSSPAAAKQSVYEAREALHQLAEGRAMGCDAAHRLISANDRRILRGRKLRAHLRSCDGCRGAERAMKARGGDLALLAPPLSAPVAAGLLEGVLGGGGGGSTGGGVLGVLTGAAGQTAAGSTVLKATTAAVTVAVAIGAYEAAERGVGFGGGKPVSPSPGSAAGPAAAGGGDSSTASDRAAGGEGSARSATNDRGGGSRGAGGAHTESRTGGGEVGGAVGGGETPTSSPPGHGGAPPGLEDKGATPPGLGGTPPPGHGGTPLGLGGNPPPGHGGTPPGQGGSPRGLGGGAPPGHGGSPPGQGGGRPPR